MPCVAERHHDRWVSRRSSLAVSSACEALVHRAAGIVPQVWIFGDYFNLFFVSGKMGI